MKLKTGKRILKGLGVTALSALLGLSAIHHREIGGELFTTKARIQSMFTGKTVVDEFKAYRHTPEYFKTKRFKASYLRDILEAMLRKTSKSIERLKRRNLFGFKSLKEVEYNIRIVGINVEDLEKLLGKNSKELKEIKTDVRILIQEANEETREELRNNPMSLILHTISAIEVPSDLAGINDIPQRIALTSVLRNGITRMRKNFSSAPWNSYTFTGFTPSGIADTKNPLHVFNGPLDPKFLEFRNQCAKYLDRLEQEVKLVKY